jgi:hypothetical protein
MRTLMTVRAIIASYFLFWWLRGAGARRVGKLLEPFASHLDPILQRGIGVFPSFYEPPIRGCGFLGLTHLFVKLARSAADVRSSEDRIGKI